MNRTTQLAAMAIIASLCIGPMQGKAQKHRLIKTENYQTLSTATPLTLQTRMLYFYSNGRGSDSSGFSILYDSVQRYSTLTGTYALYGVGTYSYNASGKVNVIEEHEVVQGVRMPLNKIEYTFAGAGIDTERYYGYDPNTSQYRLDTENEYFYNANGDFERIDYYRNGLSLSAVQYYEYNAAKKLTKDSLVDINNGVASPSFIIHKEYDNANNLTVNTVVYYLSGTRIVMGRTFLYYDANGLLVSDSSDAAVSSYLRNNYYSYDAQKRLKTVITLSKSTNGSFVVEDSMTATYTYTSFGYIDKYEQLTVDLLGGRSDAKDSTQNYYEPYIPASAGKVSKQADEFIAYPVPSSSFVNIKWHTDEPVQVQGSIVNMQGQVVQQWSDDATGDYYKSIHTANLPAGNYYIMLSAGGQQLQKAIVIIK